MPDANGKFKGVFIRHVPWQDGKPEIESEWLDLVQASGLHHTSFTLCLVCGSQRPCTCPE